MSATVDEPRPPGVAPTVDDERGGPDDERDEHSVRRRVVRTALVVLAVVLLAAGWLAFRAYQAGTALLAAKDVVAEVQADVSTGSTQQIQERLPEVEHDLAAARSATRDPVWRLAEHVPWLGTQLHAVRVVSQALHDVTRDALPAVGRIDTVLHAQEAPGTDGRIDLTPLAQAAPDIVAAAASARHARAAVDALDVDALVPQLAGPITQVREGLDEVSGALSAGAQVATLLPSMLGIDGPRTYVLVSLNSAELRSPGGLAGAFAVLHADDGDVSMLGQRATNDFPVLATPVLPLTDDELVLDTTRLGRWVQDSTMTPDFPRSAQLVAQWWLDATGERVDGVIATDPVAVSYLLGAVGPVVEPTGRTLDERNVLPELLQDVYARFGEDYVAANQFFSGVALSIFTAVGHGQGEARAVVDALARAGGEGRLRVWSARPDEQERLAATTVGGAFLSGPFDDAAGVFLNDGTAGKLDYYLTTKVAVEDLHCDAPQPTATVRLDLGYEPPAQVAALPRYVTGANTGGLPLGWLATNVTVYAPVGAPLDALRLDDGYVSGVTATTASGRRAQVVTSWLAPGGHATYRFDVPVRGNGVQVWATPTLTSPGFVRATCPPPADPAG